MFRSEFNMNNMNAWIPPTLLVVSWCTGRSLGTFLGPLGSRGYLSVVADYANPFYHSFPTAFLDVVQLENPIKTQVQKVCHLITGIWSVPRRTEAALKAKGHPNWCM